MQTIWTTTDGETSLAFVPETQEELQALLTLHEGEAFCPDCEAAVDLSDTVCPTCGEGIGSVPEHTPVRAKGSHEPTDDDGEPYESHDLYDDGEALASAGMGTDEDYGCYGGDEW